MSNVLPIIPFAYARPIVEIDQAPVSSPRCPHCDDLALEGRITCGRVGCREHDESKNSEAA